MPASFLRPFAMGEPGASVGAAPARGPSRELVRAVLVAARAVHESLGPGFVEATYENAMAVELRARGVRYERQVSVAVRHRDIVVGVHRVDVLVERCLVVEMKAVRDLLRVHEAVVRSYLRATDTSLGLLLNFGRDCLDVRRVLASPRAFFLPLARQ